MGHIDQTTVQLVLQAITAIAAAVAAFYGSRNHGKLNQVIANTPTKES